MNEQAKEIYQSLITAWNERSAEKMTDLFAVKGVIIGFDGSQAIGRQEIFSHLSPIFQDHPTAPFITKIKDIRTLSDNTVLIRSIAGMIPQGENGIRSETNAHQTILLTKNERWEIELFQNTPAQFNGRPELVQQMTNELEQER